MDSKCTLKVLGSQLLRPFFHIGGRSGVFRFRNYDPSTGTARRHDRVNDEQETVEKEVEGLVETVIKEDEEKRKQELVGH
jgi:hypothetical protein